MPLVTFAGAVFWTTLRDGLNSVVIFEVMADIYLIYDPPYVVLNSWLDMGTSLGCFSRLQSFLPLEEAEDHRIVEDFLARQEAVDIPGTVYDSLPPFELLSGSGCSESLDCSVKRTLSAVGLLDHIEARGGVHQPVERMEFSAGQTHLGGLARAMLHHEKNSTKIVLMDEAISNVDDDTAKKTQQVMYVAVKGCTILVVAHKSITKSDCDMIVEFEDGKLVNLVGVNGQATSLARRAGGEPLGSRTALQSLE